MLYSIIGLAFALLSSIIGVVYKYGKINERVCDLSAEVNKLRSETKIVNSLDARVTNLEGLHEEVRQISATLNQLVGRIDMFIQMYEKNNRDVHN